MGRREFNVLNHPNGHLLQRFEDDRWHSEKLFQCANATLTEAFLNAMNEGALWGTEALNSAMAGRSGSAWWWQEARPVPDILAAAPYASDVLNAVEIASDRSRCSRGRRRHRARPPSGGGATTVVAPTPFCPPSPLTPPRRGCPGRGACPTAKSGARSRAWSRPAATGRGSSGPASRRRRCGAKPRSRRWPSQCAASGCRSYPRSAHSP